MDNKLLADILFPDVSKTVEDLEKKYPERNTKGNITRLGPSPTGFIHLGNLYGAYVDERLAHLTDGGVIILRIEDTDDKRKVEGAEKLLIEALKEYDIEFDEGVTIDGDMGEYGPYHQSERVDIYKTVAKYMVERGYAYPSFVTEEELNEIRTEQEKKKVNTGYYGDWAKDRNLTAEEIRDKINSGLLWTLRLKSKGNPEETLKIKDGIRKEVVIHPNNQDIVLLKVNKVPTYHFAHVVDDHFMRITHVVRGEEWLSTLPIHIEIFDMLGWMHPLYCHTAHIMKMDGEVKRKLSKRKDPELSLGFYKEKGYFKEAVKEYLMSIINSDFEEWREKNPLIEITEFPFNLNRMSSSGALFDLDKLEHFSKEVISKISEDEIYKRLLNWVKIYKEDMIDEVVQNEDSVKKIIGIGRNDKKPRKDLISCFQIFEFIDYCFDKTYTIKDSLPDEIEPDDAKIILLKYMETLDFNDDKEQWFDKVKAICEKNNYAVKMKDYKKNPENYKGSIAHLTTVIRLSYTGRANSPDIWEIANALGETKVRNRILKYIDKL